MIKILFQSDYNNLVARIRELESFKDNAEKIRDESQAGCDVAFDFSLPSIKVYSIERVPATHDRREHTLICWRDDDGKGHTWYAYCNHDKHNQLVNEYRNHQRTRYPSNPTKKKPS